MSVEAELETGQLRGDAESRRTQGTPLAQASQDLDRGGLAIRQLLGELRKVIVGQDHLLERLAVGLLARGHVLLEGVPGLGKTLAVKTLARAVSIDFRRIQFTPDLLPADLLGTPIYNPRTGEFQTRKGPIFTHLLLADEINRAPAKVQSALLEAMEERQVTLGDETYPLAEPFLVLATQNPIEQEGTYPLAEAQVDRFMLKVKVGYPTRAEEEQILDRMLVERDLNVISSLDRAALLELRQVADAIYLDDKIGFGASPRATLYLARAAKALALVRGRGFVLPEDVKEIAPDVLRHRVLPTYEAAAEEVDSDALVERILARVVVP
jgi:MoxR-like ATPase